MTTPSINIRAQFTWYWYQVQVNALLENRCVYESICVLCACYEGSQFESESEPSCQCQGTPVECVNGIIAMPATVLPFCRCVTSYAYAYAYAYMIYVN